MATLALLLLGFCGSAQAQRPPGFPPPPPNIAGQPPDRDEQLNSRPMTIDDARMNFATIVESFIIERSKNGCWPLKQKTTGKLLKLKFESILPKSVHELKEGRFMGRAVLRELATDSTVRADFTVDFSGPQWKVEGMRLVSITPPAREPRPQAPAPPPAGKKTAQPD